VLEGLAREGQLAQGAECLQLIAGLYAQTGKGARIVQIAHGAFSCLQLTGVVSWAKQPLSTPKQWEGKP
jgi:hypothetical protein